MARRRTRQRWTKEEASRIRRALYGRGELEPEDAPLAEAAVVRLFNQGPRRGFLIAIACDLLFAYILIVGIIRDRVLSIVIGGLFLTFMLLMQWRQYVLVQKIKRARARA